MNSHPPPFPAYGKLTAAAAAAAAGYNAAAPSYGRPRTAEGLVTSPASYGYPVHGSPAFANAGLHGALPVQPYTTRGLHGNGSFDGALQGHAWGLPSTAGFVGAPPGHAYDAAGLRNANFFHGDAYAAPGQGHHLAAESNHLLPQRNMYSAGHGSTSLNPGARSFEQLPINSARREDSLEDGGGTLNVPRQAGRALNPGARSFERRDPNAEQLALYSVRREDSLVDGGGALNVPRQAGRVLNPGFNPRARSFQRRGTDAQQQIISSVPLEDSAQAAGRALNAAARSFHLLDSGRDAGGGLNRSFDHNESPQNAGTGATWRSLPGLHDIGPNFEWSSRVLCGEAHVKKIWRQNCLEAFEEIRKKMLNLKGRVYIAIDLEYLAAASTNIKFKPNTSQEWYESLKTYVNDGTVVQIGLAFASEERNSEISAYELNIVVDVSKGTFHPDAVDFLKRHQHDLDMHKAVGILPEWIWAGVLKNLPFGSEHVIWLAYHGDRDIGFILRMLEGGGRNVQLPPSLESFLYRANERLPLYYDVRVLAQLVKEGFHGKLTALAGDEFLNVKRTGGEHHAGSDALLTLRCFAKILQEYRLEALVARQCIMSGIEELRLPITCCRHITALDINVVEVYSRNFEEEAFYISQTIENNFSLIGVQIIAPKELNIVEPKYNILSAAVREVKKFELLIAFMNLDGNVAFGRAWKIFLKVQDEDENRVTILRLAALLASCGATHSMSSAWVTFRGEYVLALLLQACIDPGVLPVSSVRYELARASLFPKVYDLKVLAELFPGLNSSGDLSELALQLGVGVDACDAITILRCFFSLRAKSIMSMDDHS